MTDEQPARAGDNAPDRQDQAPGWQVVDPDGNIVASGGVSEAKATAWVAEMQAEAERNNEGEQE